MSEIKTKLIKKQSNSPIICTFCKNKINSDNEYYLERGVCEHIHSLIARKYCSECYRKYGEKFLLRGRS